MRNRCANNIRNVILASITSCLFVALVIVICLMFSDLKHPTSGTINVDSICPSCATCHDGAVETVIRGGWIPEKAYKDE